MKKKFIIEVDGQSFTVRGIKKKATSYEKSGEEIIFRLYHTNIVIICKHKVVLNSGGYRTATTKRRMNQILEEYNINYRIGVYKGDWYINSLQDIPFFDGMELPI